MKLESTEELRALLLADEQVHSLIAMRAYEIFLQRGGAPGHEADDWFQAEAEILTIVIDEEIRRSEALSSPEETAIVELTTPRLRFQSNDTTEKRMEVFVSVETEAVPSAQPATLAASASGGSKKAPTPAETSSSEASTKGDSPPKEAAVRLKPPKVSAKKTSGKVKSPKKAGKTKQSKHRSADKDKEKEK
jgi:hypothetical protein